MKRNIVILMLCLSGLNVFFARGSAITGLLTELENLRSRLKIIIENNDLNALKELQDLNIFSLTFDGRSLLYQAAYHRSDCFSDNYQDVERSDNFFDYVLAHSTAKQINEIQSCRAVGFVSVFELVAQHSPSYLRKILNHPDFNKESHHETAQKCIEKLRCNLRCYNNYRDSTVGGNLEARKDRELISILKEKFAAYSPLKKISTLLNFQALFKHE
jgi:hypothetical protein